MDLKGLRLPLLATVAVAITVGLLNWRSETLQDSSVPGVAGISDTHLTPQYWFGKLETPDRVLLDRPAIAAQNAKLLQLDDSMFDLRAIPASLSDDQVAGWIEDLATPPEVDLYDVLGAGVPVDTLAAIVGNRNLEAIPPRQATRFGLTVHRADLRTFPADLRVFRSPENSDIDRFQESALFPGTPVVIAHESADGRWWFVVSPRYAAWIEKQFVAEGDRDVVLGYADKSPYRIVTGATVRTVFTPEQPALSELQLDMGVRVPLLADWLPDAPVNGQYPLYSHVIELPLRSDAGTLKLVPALLQKNVDSSDDYLPLTRGNIIHQSFKFLGERYGWGHSYNGRDCSGFVSEVYRSLGVQMPRNTSAQSISPAFEKQLFNEGDDIESRMSAVRKLEVGDLVYIPGHVMMVIGTVNDEPWVIHDTTGFTYRATEGEMIRVPLNAVSVTPLLPLQYNESQRYVDRMTSIVRIASDSAREASQNL